MVAFCAGIGLFWRNYSPFRERELLRVACKATDSGESTGQGGLLFIPSH